jgi:hypothetical protein
VWNWQRWRGGTSGIAAPAATTNHAAVSLTETVLSLGGGERFYLYDKRSS